MDRLGIRWLVISPLVAMSIFAIALTAYLNYFMVVLDDRHSELINRNVMATLEALQLQVAATRLPAAAFQELAELDVGKMRSLITRIADAAADGNAHIAAMQQIPGYGQSGLPCDLVDLQQRLHAATAIAVRAANINLINNGDATAQALQIMTTDFLPLNERLQSDISLCAGDLTNYFKSESVRLTGQVTQTRLHSIVTAFAAILGTVTLGVWMSISAIVRPIRGLTATMEQLAGRDWAANTLGDGTDEAIGNAPSPIFIYAETIPAISHRDEIGSMARAVAVFRDGLVRAETLSRKQRATQLFLDTVIEYVPAPIVVKTVTDLCYVHVNRAAEALTGLPRGKLLGKTSLDALPLKTAELIEARDREAIEAAGGFIEGDITFATADGGQKLATVTHVAIPGFDGRPRYVLIMAEDVTARRRAEQRIHYLAHYDTLTKLPNRTVFAEKLTEALERRHVDNTAVAVLALDLDHFKDVNDVFGHAAGDELLLTVASRFCSCLGDDDTLARLGGDEFAIVQRNVRREGDAEALAQRLLDAAAHPFDIVGHKVHIGLSIGIAATLPGSSLGDLPKQADMALYDAKDAGRHGFRWFRAELDERLQYRLSLQAALREAVGTEQLALHYQPQVSLKTSAILGAEALMRWHSPTYGNVPPDVFIPLAEEIGLISTLGAWLLHKACATAVQWPAPMSIAVNVSPVQLRAPGFVSTVRAALEATGLAPSRLELEVTEGILLRDTESTLAMFAELRSMGVDLALDDFGTGYSSLSYLQKFRFDKIKIDRSFIKGLDVRPDAATIVRTVVNLSESLGMWTLAEGVETAAEAEALRRMGCESAQGYYFWRPMNERAMQTVIDEAHTLAAAE